jgi:branched-chain amino acid transport system substrate-binding protein
MAKRWIAGLGLASLLLGCSTTLNEEADDTDSEIVLGFAIAETGWMAAYDVPALVTARMAVDDINGEGGVDGRQLKIITANTKSEPELGGDAATEVISEGADLLVVSCDFDMGVGAATVGQTAGKLVVSACAASTAFGPTGIGDLAFTMASAASAEGAAMAEWASTELNAESVFTLLDDSIQFTKESTFGFEERWRDLDGEIVGHETFKQGDSSVASQISAIKRLDSPPDAIWLASYMPTQAAVIKQLRSAGLTMPILGDEDLDGDYWKDAVPNVQDVFFSTYASIYGDDPDARVNELTDRYVESEGTKPDTALFIGGYVAIEAIAQAVAQNDGATAGSELRDVMETYDQEAFIWPVSFTEDDHITFERDLRIMQIQDGQTSYVETLTPTDVPRPADS